MLLILSPEYIDGIMIRIEKPYRPIPIVELHEKIEGEMRSLELRLSITGTVDFEQMDRILYMKSTLDDLYGLWAEGKIK